MVRYLDDYDPSKASLRAFASGIVQQKIANLIETQFAQKRDPHAVSGSLNELVQVEEDGHPEERWTTVDIDLFAIDRHDESEPGRTIGSHD